MRIDKVKWITVRSCGKQKWHSFASSLGWKGEIFGIRHCLTKCAIESKLLNQNCWSWYHFSQEKLPHTLILVIASTCCGKYPVPFLWATLYNHMYGPNRCFHSYHLVYSNKVFKISNLYLGILYQFVSRLIYVSTTSTCIKFIVF